VHRAATSFALVGLLTTRGAAATDPAPSDVDERYDAIVRALDAGEGSAKLWWWGWTGILGGIVVGEGTIALATSNPGTRADAVVGTVGSALGVGAMFLSSRAGFTYRDRLARMDASTPEARLARLREAERILDATANDEELGQAWFVHVGGNAVTLAGTFVLWAGYHQYWGGWLNLVGGVLVSEAQILTHPRAAIRARRAYRDGTLELSPPASGSASGITFSVVPGIGGLSLIGTF
jgi:hypothetical protein